MSYPQETVTFGTLVSRPEEFHLQPLAELYLTLARHTAPIIESPVDKEPASG